MTENKRNTSEQQGQGTQAKQGPQLGQRAQLEHKSTTLLPQVSLQESLKWAREQPDKYTPVSAREAISTIFLFLIVATGLAFYLSSYAKKKDKNPNPLPSDQSILPSSIRDLPPKSNYVLPSSIQDPTPKSN